MCGAGASVESIEIDVIKPQTPVIRIDQRERRTRDVLLRDTQRGADPLYENRLSCSQWTTKQQDFPALKARPNLMSVVERRLWR